MPEQPTEIRRVAWSQVFPFIRLFRTFGLAANSTRLALAFLCILTIYIGARILDQVWIAAGSGVALTTESLAGPTQAITEIDVYATGTSEGLELWRSLRDRQQEQAAERVAAFEEDDKTPDLAAAGDLVDQWLDQRIEQINADEDATSDEQAAQREEAYLAADVLRFSLAGKDLAPLGRATSAQNAIGLLSPADATAEQQQQLVRAISYREAKRQLDRCTPRGPFAVLMEYDMRCLAAGIQGVFAGRLGTSGGVNSPEPALLGCMISVGAGSSWLITQRPCYAAMFGIMKLVIVGLFGVAICRHSAVQSARDESIGFTAAIKFARGKWKESILAPLIPIGIIIIGAVCLLAGGLIGAIPAVGHVVSGVLYGLALLGGFALALVFIGFVLGAHLMWPTIAVESSDAFDAVQRGFGYIGQRIWNAAFYGVALMVYGAISVAMVRLIAMLVLKLTHAFTGIGIGFFGHLTSSQTATVSKLDAMWSMPEWSELPLLPMAGRVPFWGEFALAPLSGTEMVAMWLIACWVFMLVTLVAAFIISFYFCGVTEVYFLLRRDVDATDWEEIYYEEDDDLLAMETADATTPSDSPADAAEQAEPDAADDSESS